MRNFRDRFLLWGTLFLFLQSGTGVSQPIHLIPPKTEEATESPIEAFPLSEAHSSLEFWTGTPPSVVETYVQKLPLKLTSSVLQTFRTKIATEPFPGLLGNEIYQSALFSLLKEGGNWEQAKDFFLTTALPEKDSLLLDLYWLEGNKKEACAKINHLLHTSSKSEWKQQNIYCLYKEGEEERAKIAIEVLKESNPEAAQLMSTFFQRDIQAPLNKSIATSPFLLTIWSESKQPIPESELETLSSSALGLIAKSESVPLQTRLLAGEKALDQGTLKAEEFAALVSQAPSTNFWKKIAQAIQSTNVEALLPLFERARDEHKLGVIGQVFTPSLVSIPLSLETLPLAPFMIRAFLQSHKKELAKKWGTFFMREAPDEGVAVRPLLHLAFPEENWDKGHIQAWQVYESRLRPRTAPQYSYELRRILSALKEPAGDPLKNEPTSPSWKQEKALFNGSEIELLESAAREGRKGETLLLALVLMGETPLREFSVDKFVPILQALYNVGFDQESRALALEFLLAKGL